MRPAVAGDRVEIDDGDDAVAIAVVRDEVLDAEAPERAGIAGEEEDRVGRLRRPRRGLRRRVRARQLEQRGRPRPVVVRAGAGTGVVAVRDDDDQLVRTSLAHREQVLQLDVSAAGDFRVKTLATELQAVLPEPLSDPVRRPPCARRAGNAVRIGVRELLVRSAARSRRRSPAAASARGSGCGWKTVNAAISSGMPTRSHVPRYIRLLTGRSSDPGRARRRSLKGGWAAMRGNSRDGPGTITPDAGLFDHPPRRRRGLCPEAPDLSAGARRVPRRVRAGRRGGARCVSPRRRSTSSCSTSCCRSSTGSRSASGCGRRARCRSSCSPPATTSSTRSSASSWARTTTSRSRSRSASSAAVSARCCAEPARLGVTLPKPSRSSRARSSSISTAARRGSTAARSS